MIKLNGITGMYDAKMVEVAPDKYLPISGTETVDTTRTPEAAIPEKVTDVFTQPLIQTGMETAYDFWNLLLGSPEQKLESLTPYLPVTPETQEIIKQPIQEAIEQEQPWVTTPTLPTGQTIDIKLPNFGDLGKWLLIGGAALGGLYLIGKLIGRGKK